MTGRTALSIAAVGAALAAPANAAAVDHVTLFVSPTTLSQPGWSLSAAVVGPTVARRPRDLRHLADAHASRAGAGRSSTVSALRPPAPSRSTAGSGRWRARIGTVAAIEHDRDGDRTGAGDRRVSRAAAARSPPSPWRCAAASSCALGRRSSGASAASDLAGSVTFNRGGPVDCAAPVVETCSPSTVLTAIRQAAAGPAATLLLSPDAGGWMTLSFADRGRSAPPARRGTT